MTLGTHGGLAARLRLMVITDPGLAAPRSVLEVVRAAVEAGAPAVQLRNKELGARALLEIGRALRTLTQEAGSLFIVNDRLDVAMALGADGVHVGPDDLPVAAVRSAAPDGFLIGRSADSVDVALQAVQDGVDYIGCGTVYATTTKADAGDVIGLEGLDRVAHAVEVPVVAIGGITVPRALEVAGTHAAGIAVVGAIMAAADPGRATMELLAAFAPIVDI